MTQLVRYEPLWMAEFERDLDALFGDMFGVPAVPRWHRVVPAGHARWAPACDVFSRDGDLVVELDLPGVDPAKDVRVTVEDGVLCISGERHPHTNGGAGYYRREWRYGRFERAITLPDGITGEGITASYHDGVLEVVVPKAARRSGPTRIPISGASEATTLATGEPAG
ncbi:MAG: Hsp20/alpha crystallin family protein [Micromonosporaceae bacterium]